MRTMLKSKIHRARVTNLNLEYEGSITIDKKLMVEADILPYEQVQVLNLNNYARFTTYVMEGTRDSGQICLNGASARLAKKGDIILILAYCLAKESKAKNVIPHLVYVDSNNRIIHTKQVVENIPY